MIQSRALASEMKLLRALATRNINVGAPMCKVMTVIKMRGSAHSKDLRQYDVSDPANPPSPYEFTDAQRRAAWKKLAEDPTSLLDAEQRAQIKGRGWRGPQRPNPKTGDLETMELSHEPTPLREGGTEVTPRWPEEHAAVDPHRQLPKEP